MVIKKTYLWEDKKTIHLYLIIFLFYILAFTSTWICALYEQSLYPDADTAFSISTLVFGMVFLPFQIFNLIMFVKFIKRKIDKRIILLSLTEVTLFLYPFLSFFMRFYVDFLDSISFIITLKIIQLFSVIWLLIIFYRLGIMKNMNNRESSLKKRKHRT